MSFNTRFSIFACVDVHLHAREDLRVLLSRNRAAAASILAVLEQIQADPIAIEKLTSRGEPAICVLAIVHKTEFDDDDHQSPLARRIFEDWREL